MIQLLIIPQPREVGQNLYRELRLLNWLCRWIKEGRTIVVSKGKKKRHVDMLKSAAVPEVWTAVRVGNGSLDADISLPGPGVRLLARTGFRPLSSLTFAIVNEMQFMK